MSKEMIQLAGEKDRLDKVLTDYLSTSRSQIRQLLDKEKILVNDKVVKANYRTKGQETITVLPIPKDAEATITPQDLPLDIVFEDDYLLVVNKPAGQVVHPSKGHPDQTLANGLVHYLKTHISQGTSASRPGIVHRIDKDTSGLLLVAKTNEVHQALAEQISNRQVTRRYLTLVHGHLPNTEGVIDVPIGRDPSNRLRFTGTHKGKVARTYFKVLTNYAQGALLEVELHTGRTHQIRVHLEHVGHPIIGDPVYRQGAQKFSSLFAKETSGQYLHAFQLTFRHPVTQEEIHLEVPVPERFQEMQVWLQTHE